MSSKSKSGVLRKAIGPVKGRLSVNLETANKLLKSSISQSITSLHQHIEDIEELQAKIDTSVATIANRDSQWIFLIQSLSDDVREDEEIIYEETALSDDGYIFVLEDGREMLKLLENKKKSIERKLQPQLSSSVAPSATTTGPATRTQGTKLPKLELPIFAGDVNEWQHFWTVFEATVHNSTELTGVEKFSYLKSRLQGDATSPIGGLPITDEAYIVAVEMLKKRFQRSPEQLVSNLYSRLKRLPRSSDQVKDLQQTFDSCEKLLRQLKDAGEDTDSNRSLVLDIYSKYPEQVLTELTRQKAVTTKSTLAEVQSALKDYIEQTDGLSDMLQDLQPFNRDTTPKPTRVQTDYRSVATTRNNNNSNNNNSISSSNNTNHSTALAVSDRPNQSTNASNQSPNSPCYFCKGPHFNSMCDVYSTADKRKTQLCCSVATQIMQRCQRCMDSTHETTACRTYPSKIRCHFCQTTGVHPSPLCPIKFCGSSNSSARQSNTQKSTVQQKSTTVKPDGTPCALSVEEQALLSTAITTIRNPDTGLERTVRVILDNGCPRTFILESIARELGLNNQTTKNLYISAFGCKRTATHPSLQVKFDMCLRDGTSVAIESNTVELIVNRSAQPHNIPEATRYLTQSMGKSMADTLETEGPPEVLIGSDYFWDLIQCNRMETTDGILLIPSKLGFLLGGKYVTDPAEDEYPALLCLTERTSDSHVQTSLSAISTVASGIGKERYPDIDEFWSLERIGINEDPIVNDDDIAQEQFNKTVRFENGRYQVCWPWKEMQHLLPTNYALALGRLKSLTRRLTQADKSLLQEYEKTIQDQLERGVIEKVPPDQLKSAKHPIHYLPHHPVIREGHATTKIRVVYDASARCGKDALSLNECLYRGPVILPDLCAILIRFRLRPIAVIADIEKAFLQLELQPSQRDVTRFLWLQDTSKSDVANNTVTYRFIRVPFGVISSPFLLGATVQFHLNRTGTITSMEIKDDIYVDNLLSGAGDDASAINLYDDAKMIFQEANMNLREWCTNSTELTSHIPVTDRCSKRTVKVLGLWWNSETDRLQLHNNWGSRNECETKRQVLQAIASIYDPLGWFQPCTLHAKCFLRELWDDGHAWDDQITDTQRQKWYSIHADIAPIFGIQIPRRIDIPATAEVNLAVFSDASKDAYAATVYLRVRSDVEGGSWTSDLVYSKSRLAPKQKSVSLPRLELLGLTIAARAAQFVRSSIKHSHPIRCFLFCDSVCVLSWLRTEKPLQRFVANRIRGIRLIENVEYHYVRTHDNPADLSTRGVNGKDISSSSFWWHGPAWLEHDVADWSTDQPIDAICDEDFSIELEKAGEVSLLAGEGSQRVEQPPPFGIEMKQFSTLRRLLRVTAWCVRLVKSIWDHSTSEMQNNNPKLSQICQREDVNETHLTAVELIKAKVIWIQWVQMVQFADIISAMQANKSHQMIKQLNLVIGEDDLIRCSGRLIHADLLPGAISPILLPKNDYFTSLVINDVHKSVLHSGISHTLSEIRRTFWVPQGRSAVRRCITRCIICRKHKGPPYALPNMPPLPRERVARAHPFQYTGIDYLGPVTVKLPDGTALKMWCCLFTCLTIRAVHLEAVTDCTAQSFVECLCRFVARRGCPEQIISDNAAQFRLAKTLLQKTWDRIERTEEVRAYVAAKSIVWKCITELAPWQGGFYERLVGVVKSTFKSTIGRRFLRWDEFTTLLTETEAIVNSRPITYVHSDFDSGMALRPMDFIVDQPTGLTAVDPTIKPEGGDASRHLLAFWKAKQRRLDNVWQQWYSDYLLSLRERDQVAHKGQRSKIIDAPTVGEVVIVKQADAPRGNWKLARVTNLLPSKDGSIRSVELKLPSGLLLKRPTNHLYRLEVPSDIIAQTTNNVSADGGTDVAEEQFLGFEEEEVAEAERIFAANFPESSGRLDGAQVEVNMPVFLSLARENLETSLVPAGTDCPKC